jgi:penicillin-binding protein 1A
MLTVLLGPACGLLRIVVLVSVFGLAPVVPAWGAGLLDLLGCSFEDAEHLARLGREGGVRLLDHRGKFLAGVGRYYGPLVAFDDLPPHLVAALIAKEDRRFLEHGGVDWWGLGRATVETAKGLATGQGGRQGGSTLTMQVLKNICFPRHPDLARKIEEIAVAGELEARLTKEQIIFVYLNTVNFGRRAYGVQAAARVYFWKDVRNMTALESAVLVQLLTAPSVYNPHRNPDEALRRAKELLDGMVDQKRLSKKAAAQAKKQKLALASSQRNVPGYYANDRLDVGWFAAWAQHDAKAFVPGLDGVPTLRTTLWPELQAIAAERMARAFATDAARLGFDRGAVVIMSPVGEILAMIGGPDFRRSQFNNAVDAERQPGSAFKLFVYLAALERGLTPSSLIEDTKLNLSSGPIRNHDGVYRGLVPLSQALATSSNTASMRLALGGHVPAVQGVARRLGVTTPLKDEVGMALGTSEMSLQELTAAYAAVANGGHRVSPRGLVEIRDRFDHTVWCDADRPGAKRALAEQHARAMTGMLAGVVTDPNGTGRRANPGFFAAGKTGTTDEYVDAWFIGFTERFVAGVWLGNEKRTSTRGVTGGGLPAVIWRDIVRKASKLDRYRRIPCTINIAQAQ